MLKNTYIVAMNPDITANDNISFHPLSIFAVGSFVRLKKTIEQEASHLALGKGERRETVAHALARMFITRGRAHTFVACDHTALVGYVTIILAKFRKLRGNAYLTVGVKKSHQNKGLGTHLITIAEHHAKKRGARRMELEVFAKNTSAIALYKRLGYEQEGVKKKAVQDHDEFDDIVFMAKFI